MADEQWSWLFFGYETPAGNRPVRDWIRSLTNDELDELFDVLVYMRVRPNSEWPSPQNFKPLEDELSEVRFSTEDHWYRIYGFFWPARQNYTFLHCTGKKVKNDRDGKKLAKDRRDQLLNGLARVHPFSFEE